MENNQKNTVNLQLPTADQIASKRPFVPVSFALAIGLFFFTFCDIKCTTGQKLASVSGIQLVTGTSITPGGMLSDAASKEKISPNLWAILALASAIGGCTVHLMRHQKEALIGAATAGLGLMSLGILRFMLNLGASSTGEAMIVLSFKPAYWLTILAFGVAGTISFFRLRLWEAPADTGAPQLVDEQVTDHPDIFQNTIS